MSFLFSVVISNFNKGPFIAETISSVLAQTYSNFEILITDDFSTDDSCSIIENFANQHGNIRVWRNERNRGANFCRNNGVQNAKGDYLIFLDSDDLLDKNCLQYRLQQIEKFPNFDMWVFSMQSFKGNLANKISIWNPPKSGHLKGFLTHRLPWTISQPAWRMSYIKKLKGFNESFRRFQDVELHTRAMLDGARVFISTNQPDCFYRVDMVRIKNFEAHFKSLVHSSLQYFRLFYVQVKEPKYLFSTTLYVLDSLWYAMVTGQITKKVANEMVELMLLEVGKISTDDKRNSVLRYYWNIKSRFSFNVKGLRFTFTKILESA